MRWLQIGVAVAFQLSFMSETEAQQSSRPGPTHEGKPRVLFDAKVPDITGPIRRFKSQPVQLQNSAIDALRHGKLPSQRTEPMPPAKISLADDSEHSIRLSEQGALEIYPKLNEIAADDSELDPKAVLEKVRPELEKNLLPRDRFSETTLEYGRIVSRTRSDSKQIQRKLIYVSARRTIGGVAVDGPGSRFSIAFDAKARVRSVLHDWGKLGAPETIATPRFTPKATREGIIAQIRQTLPRANARVQRIDLVFYDPGGGAPITPAYRFIAEIERTKNTFYTTEHLVGYVPLSDGESRLPPPLTKNIVDEQWQTSPMGAAPPPAAGTVYVGRFVARDDSGGWLTAADDFLGAVTRGSGRLKFVDAGHPLAATPAMFGKDRDAFVNSVDVALVEAHGIPLGFTTWRDNRDHVYIERDVAAPGLGSGSGGRLKHWILHSCRVIPAPTDFEGGDWYPLWKQVFNGVSSVVGYRTPMFIADGAEIAFGTSLRAGAPVVPAWFNAVNSLSIYGLDALARFQCEDLGPVGRASAVVACGSADATADQGAAVPTQCLELWWVENELIKLRTTGVNEP